MSLLRSGYYGLSWMGTPLILLYLKWRAQKGHELKARLNERFGLTSQSRPNGTLIWINAVSVGEAVAALTLIENLQKKYTDIYFLLTTTTVSSSSIVSSRLPKHTLHQFCPIDTPQAVKRFLNHWQPDLAIWIESELWPNLIYETQEKGIPTILLNGRMSDKSFSNWKKVKGLIAPLLSKLKICAVQSDEQKNNFTALGAENVMTMGNIKIMMSPLTIEPEKYKSLKKMIGDRPVWLAASTHPGEEEIVLKTHKELKKEVPNILTLMVPRHINRAKSLRSLAKSQGLSADLRSSTLSMDNLDVYIGDTLGEMGLYYALAPIVFMGATFVPKGGHNPIEAAQFGSFVVHGPHVFKNPQLYEALSSLGMSQRLEDENKLTKVILPWLAKKKESYDEPKTLKSYREKGLQDLIKLLDPHVKNVRENWE